MSQLVFGLMESYHCIPFECADWLVLNYIFLRFWSVILMKVKFVTRNVHF